MLTHTDIKKLIGLTLGEGESRPVQIKGWVRTKRVTNR